MARYSKSNSNYILAKKHQDTTQGTIWERDWVTTGGVNRIEPGKRPYFGDSNFLFTENALPVYKKKRKNGKWVGNYTYEDVKDASSVVNRIMVNRDSDNLCDYAYWGSMAKLFESSVEHIVATFPGRLISTHNRLPLHVHVAGSEEYWITAPGEILSNPFRYDMHNEFPEITNKEELIKYVAMCWSDFVLEDYSTYDSPVTAAINYYEITEDYVQYDCEGRYFKLCRIYLNAGKYAMYIDTYLVDGEIVYCYGDGILKDFIIDYYSGENSSQQQRGGDSEENEGGDDNNGTSTAGGGGGSSDENQTSNDEEPIVNIFIPESFSIHPNEEIIEEYFRNLEGFEWKLLNRDTNPLYSNAFLFPIQRKDGTWRLVRRTYTWPSVGYCIDIETSEYSSFIGGFYKLCEIYDSLWCDSIWRCMVHESIKNFDWSYRREFTDNDVQENIDGGNRMMDVMRFYGRVYDEAKRYVDGIKMTNNVTYDGKNNCPTAQISDKNNLLGFDTASTLHQFYWYEEVDRFPAITDEIVSLAALPSNVTEDSPTYISVTCNGGDGSRYYIKQTIVPCDIHLTNNFFGYGTLVEKQENPWVSTNVYGKAYVEVSPVSIPSMMTFNETNTLVDYPYQLFGTTYPLYAKLIQNGKTDRYFHYVEGQNMFDVENEKYVNPNWFTTRNTSVVNPESVDILFQRELNLSINHILKTKGTIEAIEMVMALFGFGRFDKDSNRDGDYIIQERYSVVEPKMYDDIFYFFEEVDETSSSWFTTVTSLPEFPDASTPEYLKMETSTGSGVYRFFHKNSDYTVSEAIRELYVHRTTQRVYEDYYTGVPLNDVYSGNNHMVVPFYRHDRNYEGDYYFEGRGGWKYIESENIDVPVKPWKFDETIPYLHILQKIDDLFTLDINQLNNGDIYYVANVSDYYEYDENVPYYLSNFFKIKDKFNPGNFSSWVNIPIEGSITYGNSYPEVTKEDYEHAKHLDSIMPTILYNNPHCGYDRYDLGEEYRTWLENPYMDSVYEMNYDDEYYANMAQQFKYTITDTPYGVEKSEITAATYSYEDNRGGTGNDIGYGVFETPSTETATYNINRKILRLALVQRDDDPLNEEGYTELSAYNYTFTFHRQYMMDVVMKYVAQVIPSTTILVLSNFETIQENGTENATITVVANDDAMGNVYGGGTYLKSTMVSLRAAANDGYHFVRWTKNGRLYSTNSVTNTMVCADDTYTAYFEEDCGISFGCTVGGNCNVNVGGGGNNPAEL